MKKLLFLIAISAIATIGYGQTASAGEVSTVQWDGSVFDFGKIKQGVPVTHEFKFTNKGKIALVITNAQPSCGCTIPDWTKDPVPPNQNGFVKATYNAGAMGVFEKTITVTSNSEGPAIILRIKGEVIAP